MNASHFSLYILIFKLKNSQRHKVPSVVNLVKADMAHYTCNASSHQCSTSSPPINERQDAAGNPLSISLNLKTWHLTGKVYAPRNSGWGVREAAVLLLYCNILSRGVCLSEWQLLLPRALGSRYLYPEWLQHRGGSTSRGRPSLLWCHL